MFAAHTAAAGGRELELTVPEDETVQGQLPMPGKPGDVLTAKQKHKPNHGEIELDSATGALSYTPAKDYNGEDACEVEVSGGRHWATVHVTLHVDPVNDAPTVKELSLSTLEDTPVHGKVVASDIDHDILTYRVSAPATHGEATVDSRSGIVTYRPAADTFGVDTFTVEVSDGATVALLEVPVTIAAVNDDAHRQGIELHAR